jgi:hypothetical protein
VSTLAQERCAFHPEREAAVRCRECSRFYCRECVTEHLGRMMCARCVGQALAAPVARGSSMLLWSALAGVGFLLAWSIFYYFGMALARVPASFHGGTP